LGISSSTKTRPARYFKTLRLRGQELPDGQGNPNGWGIALYPDGRAVQVIKEDIPAASSKLSEFLSTYEHLCSKIFVAHIRKASRGVVTCSNTHPFSREVGGRDYVFAHNGTIRNIEKFPLGRHKPVGSTDSEHLFCHILNFIEQRGIAGWPEAALLEFWKCLVSINCSPTKGKPNKLNMLLSNGVTLIAYRDYYGIGTLSRLILPNSDQKSISVVATNPVSNDNWESMEPGELCAIRHGVQVFSSGKAAAC
jgi:glutamine amidotransferase